MKRSFNLILQAKNRNHALYRLLFCFLLDIFQLSSCCCSLVRLKLKGNMGNINPYVVYARDHSGRLAAQLRPPPN